MTESSAVESLVDAVASLSARLFSDYGHVWDREPDGSWRFDGGVGAEMRRRQREAARELVALLTPAPVHADDTDAASKFDRQRNRANERLATLPDGHFTVTGPLIERSSLGTPEAKALRATVSDEHAARVVARSKEFADDTDAGDEGVRLTSAEKDALARRRNRNGGALFETVEAIVTHRLAEITAVAVELQGDLDRALAARGSALAEVGRQKVMHDECHHAFEKAKEAIAELEAGLGEGVVEWGVDWRDGSEVEPCPNRDWADDRLEARPDRALMKRMSYPPHTSPWVEVSE